MSCERPELRRVCGFGHLEIVAQLIGFADFPEQLVLVVPDCLLQGYHHRLLQVGDRLRLLSQQTRAVD